MSLNGFHYECIHSCSVKSLVEHLYVDKIDWGWMGRGGRVCMVLNLKTTNFNYFW